MTVSKLITVLAKDIERRLIAGREQNAQWVREHKDAKT